MCMDLWVCGAHRVGYETYLPHVLKPKPFAEA